MRRSSNLPKDPNQLAAEIVRRSTEEEQTQPLVISVYMATIGRKGGLKGGKARTNSLSRKERTNIAKKAARARWRKQIRRKE